MPCLSRNNYQITLQLWIRGYKRSYTTSNKLYSHIPRYTHTPARSNKIKHFLTESSKFPSRARSKLIAESCRNRKKVAEAARNPNKRSAREHSLTSRRSCSQQPAIFTPIFYALHTSAPGKSRPICRDRSRRRSTKVAQRKSPRSSSNCSPSSVVQLGEENCCTCDYASRARKTQVGKRRDGF